MQKKIIKSISIVITLAMFITILVTFLMQSQSLKQRINAKISANIYNISELIENNNKSIAELKENLNSDYISKTNAVAYIIQQNPQIIESKQILDEIADTIDVDEIHVTDEDAVIRWGTVPRYYDFDFKTSEQAKEFITILTDNVKSIAQEPQANGAAGILFQYIGVPRLDRPGIVQIGMEPKRLAKVLEENEIDNVISNYNLGENEFIFALNVSDNTIAYFNDSNFIGKNYSDIGLNKEPTNYLEKYNYVNINGTKLYLTAQQVDDYYIFSGYAKSNMYDERNKQIIILALSDIVIIFVLLLFINFTLSKKIIIKIKNIVEQLTKITNGDLNIIVKEQGYEEFEILSDKINVMVSSIKNKINESSELLSSQSAILEKIKCVANTIADMSNETYFVSEQVASGSFSQKETMQKINDSINLLSCEVSNDSERAKESGELTKQAENAVIESKKNLNELIELLSKVNDMGKKAKDVMKEIDDISSQTNILAVNASIEAARVGEAGKGFIIVSANIKELSNKSAEAAKNTAQIINKIIKLMNDGNNLADETRKSLDNVSQKAKESSDCTNEIITAANKQVTHIGKIKDNCEHFNQIIGNNSSLAEESKNVVNSLLKEVERLRQIKIH